MCLTVDALGMQDRCSDYKQVVVRIIRPSVFIVYRRLAMRQEQLRLLVQPAKNTTLSVNIEMVVRNTLWTIRRVEGL